jgi:hypothetical protein
MLTYHLGNLLQRSLWEASRILPDGSAMLDRYSGTGTATDIGRPRSCQGRRLKLVRNGTLNRRYVTHHVVIVIATQQAGSSITSGRSMNYSQGTGPGTCISIYRQGHWPGTRLKIVSTGISTTT